MGKTFATTELLLPLALLSATFIETTVLNCNTTQPTIGSSVMCTCFNQNKNDVRWYMNSASLTNCLQALTTCIPSVNGYSFSMDLNSSGTYYFATISSYNYSYCAEYSCHDLAVPGDSSSEYLRITDFDLNQTTVVTEPILHENGNITITTECLFMPNASYPDDIITTWYKIENDSSVSLYKEANDHHSIDTDPSDCQTCNGNTSVKLVVTYYHKDENTSYQYVKLMLHIYDKANKANGQFIPTSNKYRIKVPVTVTVPPIPLCPCYIGIIIAYLAIWIVQLQMCIYGYSQGSSYLFHGYMEWFVVLQLFAHVPLLGLTPAIYIYRPIPKSDRRYITWYTIFASAPILGIFVKAVLAWRKKKTDHQNVWKVFLFVAMGMLSMVEEIFVMLLCVVWCISQWYYPFIIALCDLITRWVLFIIIAVLYHADIKDTNTHREDVPTPLAFGIALWCTPIIGTVFNIYWKYRQEPVRCLSDGHRVAPDDKMKSPRKEITPREETHKRGSKQVASPRKEESDKTTPRALPKIPRVRSSNMLPEQATEIHTKLPPIKDTKQKDVTKK